jgi:hypothetical protein
MHTVSSNRYRNSSKTMKYLALILLLPLRAAEITLECDAYDKAGMMATGFTIEIAKDGKEFAPWMTFADTPFKLTGLLPGNYVARAAAVGPDGNLGAYSNLVPFAVPAAPTGLRVAIQPEVSVDGVAWAPLGEVFVFTVPAETPRGFVRGNISFLEP